MADVVLFEVDAHPVERSAKPIALTFEIVVGDRHRQISAHVEGHRLDLTVERKRGSPYLRQGLWQAASMAVLYDPQLKANYQRKKPKVNIMAKPLVLSVAYWLLVSTSS